MRTQVVADYTFLYMRGAHPTQSMSENVEISRAETTSQDFRHIVISTHKNVQITHAQTMCTFSLRFFSILQICKGSVTYGRTEGRTDGRTDGHTHLEDASRIKNFPGLRHWTGARLKFTDSKQTCLQTSSTAFQCTR